MPGIGTLTSTSAGRLMLGSNWPVCTETVCCNAVPGTMLDGSSRCPGEQAAIGACLPFYRVKPHARDRLIPRSCGRHRLRCSTLRTLLLRAESVREERAESKLSSERGMFWIQRPSLFAWQVGACGSSVRTTIRCSPIAPWGTSRRGSSNGSA
jgi:hypothetical protein